MFQLFLPTIIRELRSLTKVTLVIYVYDVNGMMAACRLLYTMVLDVVLPVFRVSFVSCKLACCQNKQLLDDGWKKQPKHVGEL